MSLGASFFEDVPLVEFMYLVFTNIPGGVTEGDPDLCHCVLCLLSSIIPFVSWCFEPSQPPGILSGLTASSYFHLVSAHTNYVCRSTDNLF